MNRKQEYETVIGLEVHVRLLTDSKLFCGDPNRYGDEPNTSISPVTLAHPGALPKLNKKAIEFAVRIGLATHSGIIKENYFARKNYFYPDLPKGYQISQHTTPICKGGFVRVKINGELKTIRLHRIHLEEDAGKSIHDAGGEFTLVDYNRAGTPLIEIVTEPDLRTGEEAFVFLSELRKLVRYLGISDGNMEEGSLRCDANVSVRLKGDSSLGTKVEIKNLNSMRNVRKAIEYESGRLIEMLEKGEVILQETRKYDAGRETSFPTREKEEADDYRYFPEPDLPPFQLSEQFINDISATIPELPEKRIHKYVSSFALSEYDAGVLAEERKFSDYFEQLATHAKPKSAANWMLGPVRSWINTTQFSIADFPLSPIGLSRLINLVEEGSVSFTAASGRLFKAMLKEPQKDPYQLAEELNLIQRSDISFIEPVIEQVLEKFGEKVKEYRKGKKGLLSLFVGEVMKQTRGKADPVVVNRLILEKLKNTA